MSKGWNLAPSNKEHWRLLKLHDAMIRLSGLRCLWFCLFVERFASVSGSAARDAGSSQIWKCFTSSFQLDPVLFTNMFETFFHICVACSQIRVQSLEFPFSGIYSGSTCESNTRVVENYQNLTKPCHACDPNRNSLHCPGPLHRMAIFLECGNVANKKHKQCYVAVCAHTWNPKLASLPSRAFASEPKLIHTSVTIWCGRIQHKPGKNMKRQTSAQTAYDQFEMGQSTRNDCRVVASQTLIRMRVGWHDMMAYAKNN